VYKPITLIIPALAASGMLAACGSSYNKPAATAASGQPAKASGGQSGATVKTARSAALGATVLANSQGMTLYHLSAEQNGRFICTSSSCVGIWHPLTVTNGSTPSGTGSLGTVRRPDGSEQVTYKGMPLYTFAQDAGEGQAKGQGIKDVGTWSAVTVSSSSASTPATTTSTSSSSEGGGYRY
jgi:predicted lipoprotein with Yx(FWY)xxD motif